MTQKRKNKTTQARAHAQRRAEDERAKRQRTAGHVRERSAELRFSGCLDLIANGETTRRQFRQFDRLLLPTPGRRLSVFVDLREVTELDACALLYLVARLDLLNRHEGVETRGYYPRNARALQALFDAGFEQYFGTTARIRSIRKSAALKIRGGDNTKRLTPMDWIDLHTFLGQQELDPRACDALYDEFSECVENVRSHAYETRTKNNRWYALAIRPADDAPARAVVLDLGVGIPGSIRQGGPTSVNRALARMAQMLSKVLQALNSALPDEPSEQESRTLPGPDEFEAYANALENDDFMCIVMAANGLSRFAKQKKWHGRGLSGLRDVVMTLPGAAMHVLSGRATVTWQAASTPKSHVLPKLLGTAVCLEIRQGASQHDQGARGQSG